jgi:hypothetical protein
MPGQLKRTAKCPVCGDGLFALVDTTSSRTVRREFFHERMGLNRRRRRCVKNYLDLAAAERERRALEVKAS